MTEFYNKGKRAKELVGIYRNPYKDGTFEHKEWKRGFDENAYEPIDIPEQLEETSSFIDEFEPLKIIDYD
jgi:hypothetical protein